MPRHKSIHSSSHPTSRPHTTHTHTKTNTASHPLPDQCPTRRRPRYYRQTQAQDRIQCTNSHATSWGISKPPAASACRMGPMVSISLRPQAACPRHASVCETCEARWERGFCWLGPPWPAHLPIPPAKLPARCQMTRNESNLTHDGLLAHDLLCSGPKFACRMANQSIRLLNSLQSSTRRRFYLTYKNQPCKTQWSCSCARSLRLPTLPFPLPPLVPFRSRSRVLPLRYFFFSARPSAPPLSVTPVCIGLAQCNNQDNVSLLFYFAGFQAEITRAS